MAKKSAPAADDYVGRATEYARRVVAGKIPACKWVRLACRRQLDDLKRKRSEAWPYRFDPAKANRVCAFVERMPHIKGPLAGTLIVLEAWQIFILTTAFGWIKPDGMRRFRRVYIEVPRGNGKALDIDTPIPTPDGMRRMGDIAPGDQVYGSSGETVRVTAVTPVMMGRPCYEVEFNTGDIIVADAGHQWVTDARADRDRLKGRGGKTASIKTTEEIAETLHCRNDRNHRIPVSGATEGIEREFSIPPYVLGAWLGDGATRAARFTTADDEIIDIIRAEGECIKKEKGGGKYAYAFSNGDRSFAARRRSLSARLRALGLLNNKHIPHEYATASKGQRLALLQGLMDTDGFISAGQGQCEFTQKSERIARQVYELVASLGMRPRIMCRDVTCNGKPAGVAWRVLFHAYSDLPVFRLSRKRDRLKDRPLVRGLQDYRQIVRCDPIESRPVKCIEVDSPDHCYLASAGHVITHNSALSSAVGLYCLTADGEGGAEVYSLATTRDQARIVFGDAQAMARRTPKMRERFGVDVTANAIAVIDTASRFVPLASEAHTLDGLNIHLGIIDELHAHKTRKVYDVVETGIGKRAQSMLWVITTAGADRAGICYEVRTFVTKMLDGVFADDSQFGIIFTLDEGEDWTTEAALIKANPNWGVSVRPEVIVPLQQKAQALPSATNNFLTKHLNVWISSFNAWLDPADWEACGDSSLHLDDFAGCRAWMGLDLATKTDIASLAILIERDGRKYLFARHYLPEDAVYDGRNSQYQGWMRLGRLKVTAGAVTDYADIEADVLDLCARLDVQEVGYDPHQATYLVTRLTDQGIGDKLVEVRHTVLGLSEAMKHLEALVLSKGLAHDGDPVLAWMASNVVAFRDAKDNVYPRKEREENKIDGIVAAIMAVSRAMAPPEAQPTPMITIL